MKVVKNGEREQILYILSYDILLVEDINKYTLERLIVKYQYCNFYNSRKFTSKFSNYEFRRPKAYNAIT